MRKINPVTAANRFDNPLPSTSKATSDTDLFDVIILKLLKNVNFSAFEFNHNFIVGIDFFIILLYLLIRKRCFLGIGPSCEYLFYFIYEYLNDVGLFLLYQILFYLINRFILLIYGQLLTMQIEKGSFEPFQQQSRFERLSPVNWCLPSSTLSFCFILDL